MVNIDLPLPAIIKPTQLWTGKQVFSVLLKPNKNSPMNINLETKCRNFGKDEKNITTGVSFSNSKTLSGLTFDNSFCPNDNWLVIHNSEIMCGVIDKAIIGDGSKKSMFYTINRDYGPEMSAKAMNQIAKLSARWLANQGFSIGIDDVQPGERLRTEKMKTVEKGYHDCDEMIQMSKEGRLSNQAGCNEEETLEAKLSGILSKIRDDVGTVCFAELNKYNAPLNMSLCGSKGSKINVSQMVACVGQQIISGSRIPNGFGDRSLPHFPKNSKTPAAKGFVGNSFFTGLSPSEFIFHAVSGREGLVDTAVKTAETGYMSRRLMKALEDLACHYDLSVRDSTGGMVQFKYGDDGLDPARVEEENFPIQMTRTLKHIMVRICFYLGDNSIQ
jgi:DNA-directed RNA polymerase III subunit RPC1